MRYEITSPEGKRFEVSAPDGASQADVLAYAQRQFQPVAKFVPLDPTTDMSTMDKVLAGTGKGMTDLARGAGQMLGINSQADIDEARKYEAPLMKTGAGMVGNVIGSVAGAAPAAFIPGANTVVGASLVGAGLGALQPTAADESRLQNIGLGAALGGGAQYGLGKLASAAGTRLAGAEADAASKSAQNSVRDATLKASQEAGYVVPPSMADSGLGSRVLEGVSGKYKTNQLASIKNQNVTDALARKAVGMGPDEPITREAMQTIRNQAYQTGYEPLAKAGAIETDRTFQSALDSIVADYQGASRSFPGATDNEVMKRIDQLRTGALDVGDGLKMTRILRDEANAAFAKGDNALGKATKKAATAIEDQIERSLEAAGKDGAELLKNFRDARVLMAKTHGVEKAIVESGGKVNAKVLGAMLQRGKPLTDELKTIGAFANNFKDVARVPESGFANPFTIMDFGFGTATGSPLLPLARVASRYGLLSQPYQKALVGPQYGPGVITRGLPPLLEGMEQRGAGGLLAPSIYAVQ